MIWKDLIRPVSMEADLQEVGLVGQGDSLGQGDLEGVGGDAAQEGHVQHKQICSDQAESPLGSYEELSWLTDEGEIGRASCRERVSSPV